MSKTEFTLLVDEMLNEYDYKLIGIEYCDDGICRVRFSDGVFNRSFYVAYRFMNRARLKLKFLDEMDLLIPVDPEWDLGF